ncbi:hypothetical protein DRW41_08170 [Neobacillus piezotolerans]|uniref:Uncharacterized protein n=1 Tax=Neobacillus piezotolerans TaxID=2259171 RepID=A0A3D8GTS5_9BACI|nr:hypothetical protein [Neobacillus piezotolerans]RDU37787.1 hypothetical protein DRW41_08170 [Neobacillus piezotolerans]
MRIFLIAVLMSFVGGALLLLGPIGGIIAFGIVTALLIELLIILKDVEFRVSRLGPKRDKVKEFVEEILLKKDDVDLN